MRHAWYPDIPRDYLAHQVRVEPASRLRDILGSASVLTNSLHHQGISLAGAGLKPVAWAPDGVIEAVELENHPFGLGIQWHPENLQAYEEMRALFRAFVQSAIC
jgi:putative glutamine amidotransferase